MEARCVSRCKARFRLQRHLLLQQAKFTPGFRALQAQHALSVCHNKLGDLRFVQGDLPAAREQYAAALGIRRSLCDSNSGDVPPSRQVHQKYHYLVYCKVVLGSVSE